jgi:RIO kinase 1
LVTELGAVDTELGVLKTGKEADVHLVERAVPGTSRCCLLAAKRYRSAEHRMFHRDAGYLGAGGCAALEKPGRWPGAPPSAVIC